MKKIIAELCQNHNGNFDLLKNMVAAAAQSGATHVKMQNIYADSLSFRPQFEEGLTQDGKVLSIKRPFRNEYERLKNLEVTLSQTSEFIEICHKNDVIPLTTCFTRDLVDPLYDIGFKTIKVASYDCASYQLIRELSDKFEEIIISTGATYDDEIKLTAEILKDKKFSFLHCVTLYPTALSDLNLNRIKWLKQFTNEVGFSDHSKPSETGLIASKAALTFGSDIIERHFTILPPDQTRDGPVSVNPKELKDLVDFSKLDPTDMLECLKNEYSHIDSLMGLSNRDLTHEELLNRDYYRGRFASHRDKNIQKNESMIFNWEETRFNDN